MEGTEGSSDVPRHNQLSRRQFLKLATFGSIEAGLALAGCRVINVETTPLPTGPDVPALLKETAIAITAKGEQTSFVEQPGFSKELFQEVRQSTFVLQTLNTEKKGVTSGSGGTSWLIRKDGNTCYFATNRHVLENFKVGRLNFWRPFIDTQAFSPHDVAFALHPTQDLAVIKCSGKWTSAAPPQELEWRDDVQLKGGEQVLITGFPMEFGHRDDFSFRKDLTLGEVVTVGDNSEASQEAKAKGEWIAKGLVNHGSSGSAAVINLNGKPVAVGIIFGGSGPDDKRHPIIFGQKLSIGGLFDALQKIPQ